MRQAMALGVVLLLAAGCAASSPQADAAYARQLAAARTYTPVPPAGYGLFPPPAYAPPLYEDPNSPYPAPACRTYEQRAWVDNRYIPVYGTVCQQWDGTWRIVR